MADTSTTFDPDPESPTTDASAWKAEQPHPVTWPRRSDERYQPRSRLNQALDVAQRIIETPQDPWARAATPEREQLMPRTAHRSAEPTLFAQPREQLPQGRPASAPRRGEVALTEPETAVEVPPDAGATPVPAQDVFGPGAEAVRSSAIARSTRLEEPLHLVVDLRPEREPGSPAHAPAGDADYGLGSRWGASFQEAAQGWVRTTGQPVWRPVVSTTDALPQWDIDTYLGIVTAEVAVEAKGGNYQQLGSILAKGRSVGMEGLVEEAIERGAHGIVGVSMAYTPIGSRLLITITGTAVTLVQPRG